MHRVRMGILVGGSVLAFLAAACSSSAVEAQGASGTGAPEKDQEAVLALFQAAMEGESLPTPVALPIQARQGFGPLTLNGVLQDERLNREGKTLDSEATSKLIDRIADLEHRRQVHFQIAGAVRDQVIRERIEAGHFKPLKESQGAPMLGDSVFRQVLEHEQHGRILVEVDPQVDGRIEMYQGLEQDLRAEAELELYRFFNELPETATPTNADSEVAASSHSQVPNPEIP